MKTVAVALGSALCLFAGCKSSSEEPCESGMFDLDKSSNTDCQPFSNCEMGTYVSSEGNATTDRACTPCLAGTFSVTQNASSCADWLNCSWSDGGVAQTGTATTDAVCGEPNLFRQFGTYDSDEAQFVEVDTEGNVYVAGSTLGVLGSANYGGRDAFIRKYASSGTVLWTNQIGSAGYDDIASIAVGVDGNVYIAAYSDGRFLRKYDSEGNVVWSRASELQINSIAISAEGSILLAGTAAGQGLDGDAYVRKYSADGAEQWTSQFGTSAGDWATAVALGSNGDVYVAGSTHGDLEGTNEEGEDAFVRKYSADGSVLWTKQLGSTGGTAGDEDAHAIDVGEDGSVYVAGRTSGILAAGAPFSYPRTDAFVRKYAADGSELWTKQIGTVEYDDATGVAVDSDGSILVAGWTRGSLGGDNAGSDDIYVRKYAPNGDLLGTKQFGSSGSDLILACAADDSGNVYFAGYTEGDLGGENAGQRDAFVGQISSETSF